MHTKLHSQLPNLIGKTIAHIVMKERSAHTGPREQLYLVFTDGTYYELYGAGFLGAGAVDHGSANDILNYGDPSEFTIFKC